MKSEVSLARIEVNRENAKKSTGPKNTSLTRFNAERKNIHHNEILLKDEDSEEFRKLNRKFRTGLAPAGVLENYLVDRVVAAVWRLKRIMRIETCQFECIFDEIDGLVEKIEEIGDDFTLNSWKALTGSNQATFRIRFGREWLMLAKYEKAIEKQIYRALKELNRLQSARRRRQSQPAISEDIGDLPQL